MGLIAEYQNGPCTIKVFDDSIVKTQAEVDEIIRRVSRIIYQEELRKHMARKNKATENASEQKERNSESKDRKEGTTDD